MKARVVVVGKDLNSDSVFKMPITPDMEYHDAQVYREWLESKTSSGGRCRYAFETVVFQRPGVMEVVFQIDTI